MCQRTIHPTLSGVTSRDVSENSPPSIVRCYIEGCVSEWFTQHCQVLHRGMCQGMIHLPLSGVKSREVSGNDSLALSGVTSRDVSVNGSRSIVRCYIEGCVREWFTWHCQVLHRGACQRTIHSTLSGVTSRDVWPEFREMFQVVHGNLRCKIIADMEFVT